MRKIRRRSGEDSGIRCTGAQDAKKRRRPGDTSEPKRLQIVGFKNSGKTTLAESLLRTALGLGWRASTIKHHGHGGTPDLPPQPTDASRFFETGADSSIVVGDGVMLLQGRQRSASAQPDELNALIRLTEQYAQPDLILIEGFKNEPFPKIVLVRSLEDQEALRSLTNIELIVAIDDDLAAQLSQIPKISAAKAPQTCPNDPLRPLVYARQQHGEITAWFTRWLKGASI